MGDDLPILKMTGHILTNLGYHRGEMEVRMNRETLYTAQANVKTLSAVVGGFKTILAGGVFEQFNGKIINARLLNAFKALETDDGWYIRLDDPTGFKSKDTIQYRLQAQTRSIEIKEKSYDRAVYASCDSGYVRYGAPDDNRLDGSSLRTEFELGLKHVEARLKTEEDLVKNFTRYCAEYKTICEHLAEVSDEYEKLPVTFRNSNQLNRWGN